MPRRKRTWTIGPPTAPVCSDTIQKYSRSPIGLCAYGIAFGALQVTVARVTPGLPELKAEAKALGIEMPLSLLLRINEVIE